MAVSNLHRATNGNGHWEELTSKFSAENLSIESISSRRVEPLCENYPFEQTVYTGDLRYQEKSEITPGREIDIDFEYRPGSNLLIIELDQDVQSVQRIAKKIADGIPGTLNVYRNLHAPEDSLWEFLIQADRIIEINVLEDGEEKPYDQTEATDPMEVIGSYPIENARVAYSFGGENIVVEYCQGTLQINSDQTQAREYIIQLFEREVLADISD